MRFLSTMHSLGVHFKTLFKTKLRATTWFLTMMRLLLQVHKSIVEVQVELSSKLFATA